MLHKSFDVLETKAEGEAGEFSALVSVFGNIDSVGDRILPGAYTKTLAKWQESGDPIPVILSHDWANPMSHVGVAYPNDVKQTPRGLLVKGKLDIADNAVAAQVYKLMKRRSLKEFSIGYKVPAGGEHSAEDGANDITEIDLVECGPTLKGANSETELQSVKSALDETDPAELFIVEFLHSWTTLDLQDKAKEDLTLRVQEILGVKQAEVTDKGPKARSVDPLRTRSDELTLEVESAGRSLHKPAQAEVEPKRDIPSERELRRRSRDLMLEILSGHKESA